MVLFYMFSTDVITNNTDIKKIIITEILSIRSRCFRYGELTSSPSEHLLLHVTLDVLILCRYKTLHQTPSEPALPGPKLAALSETLHLPLLRFI